MIFIFKLKRIRKLKILKHLHDYSEHFEVVSVPLPQISSMGRDKPAKYVSPNRANLKKFNEICHF